MIITVKNNDTLILDDFKFKCCVGKYGITKHKVEGDKKTPKGVYQLDNLYYRKDKFLKLNTRLKTIPINKNMGWCDDPKSNYYNKLIKYPFKYSSEKLYKKNNTYDIILVINYNLNPVIPGKGSAVFLHIATKNYKPTKGCIAVSKKNMRLILKHIKKNTTIIIN